MSGGGSGEGYSSSEYGRPLWRVGPYPTTCEYCSRIGLDEGNCDGCGAPMKRITPQAPLEVGTPA